MDQLQQMLKDRDTSISDVEEVLRLARGIVIWPLRDETPEDS